MPAAMLDEASSLRREYEHCVPSFDAMGAYNKRRMEESRRPSQDSKQATLRMPH
jgi:hypothetical protein